MPTSQERRSQSTQREVWLFANCEFDDLRYELKVGGRTMDVERKTARAARISAPVPATWSRSNNCWKPSGQACWSWMHPLPRRYPSFGRSWESRK
jgi:hypothetical protein